MKIATVMNARRILMRSLSFVCATMLALGTIPDSAVRAQDNEGRQVEELAVDYIKSGASDPTGGSKLADAGIDFSVGLVTLGLTALGIPGAGVALGELKGLFQGSAATVPDAVALQLAQIKKDINNLKTDLKTIQNQVNDNTVRSAFTANQERLDVVLTEASLVRDLAIQLKTVKYMNDAQRRAYIDDVLNRADTILDHGDNIWNWDNVHIGGPDLKSTELPVLKVETVRDLHIALRPYLHVISVLTAAIDMTGLRPAESKLKRHLDYMDALTLWLVGTGAPSANDGPPDDGIVCKEVARPLMPDGRRGHVIQCSSAFATMTASGRSYDSLRLETYAANLPALQAISAAKSSLNSAGVYPASIPLSNLEIANELFAIDQTGTLLKFEHVRVRGYASPPSKRPPECYLPDAKWRPQCRPFLPATSLDETFSRAQPQNGNWGGLTGIVQSDWVKPDDLLVYALKPDGTLNWKSIGQVRSAATVAAGPVAQAPSPVGSGWGKMRNVFSTGEGIIYGVDPSGDLIWYHHLNNRDGLHAAPLWEQHAVGNGWGGFVRLFSPGKGVIYAVKPDGSLMWYRHNGYLTGARVNEPGSWSGPRKVGTGWADFKQVFAAPDGGIYAVNQDGELLFYKHKAWLTGDAYWEKPVRLSDGWGNYSIVFAAMGGSDQVVVK